MASDNVKNSRSWTVPLLLSLALSTPRASGAPMSKGPTGYAATVIDRPIRYDSERVALSLAYLKLHYGIAARAPRIVPRAIVLHWTAGPSVRSTWNYFNQVRVATADRRHLGRGGALNVSAHYLVDRDGTIYRLMPETWMARHCIGLNYDAIGIENVGDDKRWPLTAAQVQANAWLVRQLVGRHQTIRFLLGHHEWRRFEHAPFFRELDPTYRNSKRDPGPAFMRDVRRQLLDLKLGDRWRGARSREPRNRGREKPRPPAARGLR